MARAADSVRSHFRGICEALASLAFPALCRICARILDTGSPIPFCRACTQALTQTLPEPLCAQCGRPIVSAAAAEGKSLPQCHLCRSQVYAFDFARSFGAYTPRISRAILLLKFGKVAPVGDGSPGGWPTSSNVNRSFFPRTLWNRFRSTEASCGSGVTTRRSSSPSHWLACSVSLFDPIS
jgi:hypothetical protein